MDMLPSDEIFDQMLPDIKVVDVEMDFDGEDPQIALKVAYKSYPDDPRFGDDTFYAFVEPDGSVNYMLSYDDPQPGFSSDMFDVQLSNEKRDGCLSQEQLDALSARVEEVARQGAQAAVEVCGNKFEDRDWMWDGAEEHLAAHRDEILVAANAASAPATSLERALAGLGAASSRFSGGSTPCGQVMPIAKRACVLGVGHAGPHR